MFIHSASSYMEIMPALSKFFNFEQRLKKWSCYSLHGGQHPEYLTHYPVFLRIVLSDTSKLQVNHIATSKIGTKVPHLNP